MTRTPHLALVLLLAGAATAQIHTPPHVRVAGNVDSGYIANPAAAAQVVFRHAIRFDQTTWLQFRFGEMTSLPEGSFVRMTATVDDGVQRHDGVSLADWSSWSASFNGNEVTLELVAGPGTRGNRVTVDLVLRGLIDPVPETICGPTDDRTQSNDPRQGRLVSGCTGWLIGELATASLMLSAGHCVTGGPGTLELNVPNSTAGGQLVRSHPDDQYPYTVSSSLNAGIGSDWGVCQVGANSNTGLLPTQANGGQFYSLGAIPGAPAGQNIRITGYGVSSIPTLTQVQKTHVGPLAQIGATSLCYQTDTTGGNSGSPVIHENNGTAIGIHTHGGCTSAGTGCNSGTRVDRSDLQTAIANAGKTPGVFQPYGAGCLGTGMGPSSCASINGTGGTSSLSTAPNEYAYTATTASAIVVTGFSVWTGSNTGGNVTVNTALYADAGGQPAATPLATGTMTVTPTVGFHQTSFPPTAIGAGTFHIAVDHSATTTYLATLSGGTAGTGHWRRPPLSGSWSISGIIAFPSYQVFCQGGGGTGAIPVLSNTGLPEINNSFTVNLSQARANTLAVLWTGFSDTMWAGGMLPFSFAGIGAPGCDLLAEPVVDMNAMVDASGNASISLMVPNDPILIGKIAYHQWFVVDPPANAIGVVVTNAAKATVGG